MIFGPDIGDKTGFAKHSPKNGCVQRGAPNPMASYQAIALGSIPVPDELGYEISDE